MALESIADPWAQRSPQSILLEGLTPSQQDAVRSEKRRVLVVAGAGSGKTEVMARRVAWWVAVDGVPKGSIVAFTFTERTAEEMKFRIRYHIQRVTPPGDDATLGDMYVGTIHGFCFKQLRESRPDDYHNYDVVEEGARIALVQGIYYSILGLPQLESILSRGRQFRFGQYATIDRFLYGYDLLNEYDELDVTLRGTSIPYAIGSEGEWCKEALLQTKVGQGDEAKAFALAAARFYAYMRCRRFLDFSTSQSELVRLLRNDPAVRESVCAHLTHVVVDEVQDINPVQDKLIRAIVGKTGWLTAVGDHRQAIFGWRGGRVEIMAALYAETIGSPEGEVIDLAANFRSTPRIIDVANRWARTIGTVRSMRSPDMDHGRLERRDLDRTHVSSLAFATRGDEARWIADKVHALVRGNGTGAFQDSDGEGRGLAYTDVAILLRSSTDARTYMTALERQGIPAVFRAGTPTPYSRTTAKTRHSPGTPLRL